jgi:hypothetical protein
MREDIILLSNVKEFDILQVVSLSKKIWSHIGSDNIWQLSLRYWAGVL